MSNLANQFISQSYVSVLNIGTASGSTLTATPQPVTDGNGTVSPLQLSISGITVSGSIVPLGSGSFDLGSPTNPFRHLYVSSGSVYLDNNQVLTLESNNTTVISPSQNTIRFINDVVFDAENSGSNVGGQFTMLGVGPSTATQTLYSGDFHFLNTNGYMLLSNKIPGMTAGSGSINLMAEDTGSINIYTDNLPLNLITDNGTIGLQVSGSGNIITTIDGNNQNSLTTTLTSSSVNFNHTAYEENYTFNSQANTSQTNLISQNSSTLQVGVADFTGATYQQQFKVGVSSSETIFQDYDTSGSTYSTWMTLQSNSGNNPKPILNRGVVSLDDVVVTGSVNITGNYYVNGVAMSSGTAGTSGTSGDGIFQQTGSFYNTTNNIGITGSLIISGAAVADLQVTGGMRVGTNDGNGFTIINPANVTVDTTLVSNTSAFGAVFGSTGSISNLYVGVYDQPNYNSDVEFNLSVDTGSGIQFKDWDNVSAGAYIPWMTIAPNLGNNPAPQFKRSVAVSGSLVVSGSASVTGSLSVSSSVDHNIRGNVQMTGSLNISGSGDFDLNLYGKAKITGPSTGGQKPLLSVSSSIATAIVNPDTIYSQNSAGDGGMISSVAGGYTVAYKGDGTELALSADATQYGSGWSGPAIMINDNLDNYPAMIGFQTKTGYTDGTITLLKNTKVSGSLTVTGSAYIKSGSNFPEATGSALVAWNASTGQLTHTTYASALPVLMAVGAFYSTGSYTTTANTSGSFIFDTSLNVNSVYINGSGSHVNIDRTGTYNLQYSIQIEQGSGAADVAVWLKKDGSNVADTATYLTAASNTKHLMALNLWDTATSGSYYEIAYQSNSNNTTFQTVAASGNIPRSPSIILTVNQVR